VTEAENEGEVICGHLSMLLDLCFLQDGKYLVTCDRDEKIRVSHYPNTYNIQVRKLLKSYLLIRRITFPLWENP